MELSLRLYYIILVFFVLYPSVEPGCQNIPLTLRNRQQFPDQFFTASSTYDNRYLPQFSRFSNARAWAPRTNAQDDYLQIDLGALYKICAVAARGSGQTSISEWVTQYKLHFSRDNFQWNVYKATGTNNPKLFAGNTDSTSTVKHNVQLEARFVRFEPTAYNNHKCIRVEVYGTPKDCTKALQIGNRGVPDAQMTSSSHLDSSHTASRGRLYGDNSWCSSTSSNSEYLQVDLGHVKTVSGIATQGDKTLDKWVQSYTIRYSNDYTTWHDYADQQTPKVLSGNSDRASVRVNWLRNSISARYIRVVPQTWSTAVCMRIEVYGCPEKLNCDNIPLGLENGLIQDSQMTASSLYNTSYAAHNGRLHYTGGPSWCASTSDSSPYLQIDLGSPHVICAVATQGNSLDEQWTTSYTIQGSTDGSTFEDYTEGLAVKDFLGNFDQNTVVKYSLYQSLLVRYLRFLPNTKYGASCIRAEIYGTTPSVCQHNAVGIRSGGGIPDYRMTSSSQYSSTYATILGRLYSSSSWATKNNNDANDYLQVDLGAPHVLCAIATQGARLSNEWTKTYIISLSVDGRTWSFYQENNAQKIFVGNVDKSTVVRQIIANAPVAKLIRFYPKTFHNHKQMRVEVYGLRRECRTPLGVERFMGIDPVTQLSSSSHSDAAHSHANGRLYGPSAWCTTNTANQYIQIDLLSPMTVTGIVTQGDPASSSTEWVTSYDVQFGFSNSKWVLIKGIQGNTNATSIATHWFNKPMGARYVRILPQTWNTAICIRLDVYGCKQVAPPDIDSVRVVTNLTASNSFGEISCSIHALPNVSVAWKQGQTRMTLPTQMSYQNGFATSVLRVDFTKADDYAEACSRLDPTSRTASCSRKFTCVAFYGNTMIGPADSKDGQLFVELDVPSAPTSVTISNIFDNSATLTWSQPPLTTIREATITLFQIEYQVEGSQRVDQDTATPSSRRHTIGGLLSNTSYVVKLRAVSHVGEGLSSTKRFRTLPTILCQDRALGMELGSIPDYYITASSQSDDTTLPSNARLNKISGSSWCASTSDSSPYLQIDLGTRHVICAVATQGDQIMNQWVTSYSLLLSDDGINWKYFLQQDKQKIFSGNADGTTVIKHALESRAVGRLVRFIPRTHHGGFCMRVEVYGKEAQKGCAEIPVGLASINTIADHRFTASTTYSNNYLPQKARLGSDKGWASKTNSDPNDYLQIDLGTVFRICAVATLGSGGSANEYVKKYRIFLSMDNGVWNVYKINGNEKIFPGNVARNTLVKNLLTEEVSARFIRFNPTDYYGHKTIRVEVYGVPQDCKEPIGIENRGVEDAQMTSSSHLDGNHTASRGRLYGDNSWCSSTSSNSEYLQVNLGHVKTVSGIATQGDKTLDKWVKTFTVSYSMDGNDWIEYTAGKTIRKVFGGNSDKSSVAVKWLSYPFNGRYVRVIPLTWNAGACLRLDLYGCAVGCDNLATGVQQSSIPDSQITASSEHDSSTAARNGRLHYTGGPSWCASTSDSSPYLQIDLGPLHVICAVATQGDHITDHLVETYAIQGSTDGVTFSNYQENSIVKTFWGNFDRNSVVKHILKNLFIAKIVRFLPRSHNVLPCMRVEVYGSTTTACARQPVGQRFGSSIKDYRITASSEFSSSYPITSARLYAPRAWATRTSSDSNDYVQVDMGARYALCSIATQGSPISSEWVRTYKVSISLDGKTWSFYHEGGSARIFVGNTDQNTVVKRNFTNVITARFVRIYPVTYSGHKDLRFEVYGLRQPWYAPLGLETGSISNDQLHASSFSSSNIAAHARLYGVASWCRSSASSAQSYLQIDLWTVMQISGLATQGNPASNSWVTSYDLQFSYSTSDWRELQSFQGNVDKNGLVIHMFNQPISARYLRILPKSENALSCLRVEVYGNEIIERPEILNFTQSQTISARNGSWVEFHCDVRAQEFVTILWKHKTTRLSGTSLYSGGVTRSTLVLTYTNGDDFASRCLKVNLNSQASDCSSLVTCHAFYEYLLSEGSDKRVGTVYTNIKVPLAPVNVTFLEIGFQSAEVYWSPSVVTIDRASVRYYQIQYYPVHNPSDVLNITQRITKRILHIGGLDANTSYVVQIRAVSIAGEGLWARKGFSTMVQIPCSKRSLGMEDKTIPGAYITSSSDRDISTKASSGRLMHTSSWCSATGDSSPYLQVDLGTSYVICAVATQGSPVNDEWVTSYVMQYSRDGMNWRPLVERNDIKMFSANYDRSSVVNQEIPDRLVARSVRLVPKSWNGSPCLRVELFGEIYRQGCAKVPIGVQSPSSIPDHRFTATSYFSLDHRPSKARPGGDHTWRPKTDDNPEDYLQIDLGTTYTICGIQTDRQSTGDRALSFIVHHSLDNLIWDALVDLRGRIKVFTDRNSTVGNKISARFVRIFPREFSGHKSLRVQLYGVAEVCKYSLGVENKGIENNQMTSSSHRDNTHTASHGRLYGNTSWCSARPSSLGQYIDIDLGRVKTIRGVATQGDHVTDGWVRTYTVSYSTDGRSYVDYTGGMDTTKIFQGNRDGNSVVANWLRYPVIARFVRVLPQKWNDGICLRVDFYGCQATCSDIPLGLESGLIQDSQMTASSLYNNSYAAHNGRLHYTGGPSWCASTSDSSPYLQIDLGSPHVICAVATQGDHLGDHWVKKYRIMGSLDGKTWRNKLDFTANSDRNTQVKHDITVAMTARFIKFLATRSYGNACMRVELYGTTLAACSKEPVGVRWGGNIRDHRITATSFYSPEYLPNMARLDGPKSWSPRTTTNDSDFLQVDLGSVHLLAAVATQGGGQSSQWTISYTLATSLDGSTWVTLQNNNTDKVFLGNTDSSTVVKNTLSHVIVAKFVRFYPRTYHVYKQLRVEVYGIQLGCHQGLGMESGRVQDTQLSAWSSAKKTLSNATSARLYGHSGWTCGNPVDSYLQIDLVDARMVTGIATQGYDGWVDSYDVKFGFSTSFWYQMRTFKGNQDNHSVVVNWLSRPLGAVFVRIFPTHWKSVPYIRVDLYGCERVASPRVMTVSLDRNLTAITGSAVTLTCSVYGELFTNIRWLNATNDITRSSSSPSHDRGLITGNITITYTSAEMVYDSYVCRRVSVNRTVRCWTTITCSAYYVHYTNEGFDEQSIRIFINLTLPDAPSMPSTSNMNTTSVTVTWSSPDPGDGSILSYKVKYSKYGSNVTRILNSTSTGNSSQSIRLTSLEPYTGYSVSVVPVGSIGNGLESPPRVFVTYLMSSIYVPSSTYIFYAGQINATLQCYGNGYPLPNVTWTKSGLPVSSDQYVNYKISQTNVSSQLMLGNESGVTYQEAGDYTCHVVNHVDGQGPISSLIEVIFTPEVKVIPAQIFSLEGTTVIMDCYTAGVPSPVIRWTFNGQQLPNNTQVKNNSLIIKNIVNTAENEGTYTCVATNRAGVAQSSANLTVWVLPRILEPLENVTLMVGTTLNMTCAVSGDPLPTVSWTKENAANLTGVEYFERSTRLVIRSVTVRDEGIYVCNASSKAGWSVSRAFVTIKAAEEVFLSKPYTRSYRKNQTNITALCYGKGYPKPTITWLRNNRTVPRVEYLTPNDTSRLVQVVQDRISEPLDNVTSRLYLRIAGIMYDDAGNYTCRVTNGVGKRPVEKTLEILFVPEFTVIPENQIVVVGSHVVFTCAASGVPTPHISWLFNNETISRNVTNGNLFFRAVHNNRSYEGDYTCVARSRAGEKRRTVYLYVDELPKVSRIEGPSQVELDTNLTLTCIVTGDPVPFVYWTKDGSRDIPNAFFSNMNRTLSIDRAQLTVEGDYRCVAWNRAGNDSMEINVTALAYPTVHVTPPYLRAYLLGQTNISITCKGSGYPTPSVRWKKGDDAIPLVDFWSDNDTDRVVQLHEGNITNPLHNVTSVLYLRTRGIKYSDAGNYTCEVVHSASLSPANQTVEVLFKPEFVFTSNDQIVLTGNDVTFSCLASGVPAPSIGWVFNGGNITVPYRTSDTNITIMNVKNDDQYEGNYTCMATSRAGTDRHMIQLEVDVPSSILNITGSTTIMVNTAINLTCAVDGDPYPNVFWVKDESRNISGAIYHHDNRNLVVRHAQIQDEGEYRCMAENRAGNDSRTVDISVLVPSSIFISHPLPTVFKQGDVNQTIDCYGNSYPKPIIFWSRSDVIIPMVLNLNTNNTRRVVQVVEDDISQPLENVTSRLYLKTSGLTYAEAGNYSCQVSNNVSTALRIVEVLFFPIIDIAPSDQIANEGANISFTCQASGVPRPSVTWLFNGQAIPWYYMVENQSLLLWNVRNGFYEGNYTCLATSRAGQTNYTAQLVVDVPPRIVEVSGNRTYLINTKISLTCNVTGDPVPSVSWTRPGAKPIGNAVFSNSNRTIVIEKAGLEDEGEYLCVADNRAGNASYQVVIIIQALVRLYVPPPITRSYLQKDQNITIDCFANGYPKPSISWWFNGRPVLKVNDVYPNHTSQVVQVTRENISEKLQNVTSRLYIRSSGILLIDAGNYTCNASNEVGDGPQVQSVEVLFRPEIQHVPESITVLADTNVSFFCNATGVPEPQLTWTFSEGSVRSTNVTGNNLVIPYVQNTRSFEGVYTCNATNRVGWASTSARLTIHTLPKITVRLPASVIIERGTNANLTCQSIGDPEPAYRWYKAGQLITQSYQLTNGNKTLLLSNVTAMDEGRYTCEAYSIEGSDATSTNITVHAVPVLLRTLPMVSGIIVNQTIQLSCRAESIPPPNVTWLRNGRLVTNDSSGRFIVRTSGTFVKSSSLTINNVIYEDRGTFECVFRNYRGVVNTTTILEVYVPPTILTPLSNRTYPKGRTLNITCLVTGKPYPSVYWFKSGSRDIPRAQLSNRNTTLVIDNLRFEDRGEYRCLVVNKGGNDSSTAKIVVTVPTAVEISSPLTRVYRRGMLNVNITCYAIGYPKPRPEWRRHGLQVPVVSNITENNEYKTVQIIRDDISGVQSLLKMYSVLYLRPAGISYGEAGNYSCVANRSVDGLSAQETIEVLFEPEFDVTPRSQIVTPGSNVTFYCNASGIPSPQISWFFNGQLIDKLNSVRRDILKIFFVQNTDAYEGLYTCRASSRAGTSNYTASLTVDVKPIVIDVVGNTTVLSGSKINLTCVVQGDPAPSVLWKKDGLIIRRAYISNNTNSLIIDEAMFDDKGNYQCIATNRAGNDTRQVRMTVLVPAKAHVQPPLTRVFKQKQPNVFIDCYGNGYPKPSVHWSVNGAVISIVPNMARDYANSTVQIVNDNISRPLDNATSRLYLRKEGLTLNEAGNYSCSVDNRISSTSVKTVEVLFTPEFEVTPTDKVVLEGSTVLFKCSVLGVPRPDVTWYFSGGSLPIPHTVQESNLLIPDVKNNLNYEGNYTCVGASRAGRINSSAQLIIHVSPFLVVSLNNTLVVERGDWVTLFCEAAGDPEPVYLWTRDGVKLTASDHVRFHDDDQKLVLTNVTTRDNGVYKCLAYNVEGNVSTSTNLTVHATVSLLEGLPARTEILERETLTLSCKAESIPLPNVAWYRNGQEIQNVASGKWKIHTKTNDSILSSTISLQNISYSDRGSYSCVFTNYRGHARSSGSVIVQVPPAILLPPFSISSLLNKNVTFNCTLRGYPEPKVTWSKDGALLSQSNRVQISRVRKNASIELTSNLNIMATVREDTGDYICNGSNVVGTASKAGRLTILEKPDPPHLSLVLLTSTTALLQWNATFNGNSPIRYYTIYYSSIEGSWSINITADQPNRYTFKGLLAATQYVFKATTSNDIGTSFATVILGTTLESVPWQPRNIYAQSLSSTSIFVNWTSPARTNGNLTRYVVFIRRVTQTIVPEFNFTVVPSLTYTVIRGLTPYTYYKGEVQAYTSIGGGNRSVSFDAVLTFEDVPDVPRRLRATQSTSTSITLSWRRPAIMNGILRAYQITIRQDMSNATVTMNVTQDIMEEIVTYTVTGLRPFTMYNITVFAVTTDTGNGSNTIVYTTDEDKPGQPRDIQSNFDGEFYEVTWLPPLIPNGIITGYKVLFQVDQTAAGVNDIQDKEFTVEGRQTSRKVKLSDLNGNKTYIIRVQAKTSKGYGSISISYSTIETPITDPPQPETPSQTPEVTKSTAIINIPKFSDINGKIEFYGVINVVIPKEKQSQLQNPGKYTEKDLVSYCEAHQSDVPAAYLAFRFDSSEYEKHKVFVLGAGQGTKCTMRVARASDTPTYYNGPLRPGTEYKSFTRGYTSEKTFADSGYFGFTTQRKSSKPSGSGGNGLTTIAVGAVIGIIVVIVVVAVYLYRRKRNTPRVEEERELNEIGGEGAIYDNVDAEAPQQRLAIPVEDLKNYYLRMHADSDHLFDKEYKSIQDPVGVTTSKCDLPINKPKNRYGNIKAYDHSRVVLSTTDQEPGADYINANYIDGYSKKNHYIATIGPKQSTCDDFWRMVWEQNSSIIVMLTRPEENGKTKCHQYWPDGESSTFGRITVKLEEKEELADFEIRTFSLQMLSQPQLKPRKVTHFFFTSWPDHDVPDYATGLLEFWKRVKKYQSVCHEKGPMIVHCSAGVGRTGTFIVIDAMMDQIQAEGELDVYSYVTKIRSQRNFMVQKASQYAFIHYALLEAVTFGHTEIDVQDLRTKLAKLEQRRTQTETTGLEKQFELLNGVVPDDTYDFVTAVQPNNAKRNRFSNILPFDRTRVVLPAVIGKEDCTYINASYLEGYQEKVGYIATQAPLVSTVVDFWRMVWETEIYSIVMLCTLEEPTKVPYVQYWPDKDSIAYGSLLVETRRQQEQKNLIIREFNVTNTESGEVRRVLHFNYLDWPEHRQPTNLLSLIDLIGAVQKARRQHADRPIVVHCSNGIGRTGAFCTLFTSLERVKLEGYLDVFITARMLRTQRPGMVETLDQYRMCYQAILAYLDSFEESQYQNFM